MLWKKNPVLVLFVFALGTIFGGSLVKLFPEQFETVVEASSSFELLEPNTAYAGWHDDKRELFLLQLQQERQEGCQCDEEYNNNVAASTATSTATSAAATSATSAAATSATSAQSDSPFKDNDNNNRKKSSTISAEATNHYDDQGSKNVLAKQKRTLLYEKPPNKKKTTARSNASTPPKKISSSLLKQIKDNKTTTRRESEQQGPTAGRGSPAQTTFPALVAKESIRGVNKTAAVNRPPQHLNFNNSKRVNNRPPTTYASASAVASASYYNNNKLSGSYNKAWCPRAICHNTELCYPCRRRFLILITTARSASTTLTWMLNVLPGIRMSGENANTLGLLKQLMDNILNNPNFKQSTGQKSSWGHRFVPPQSLSCVSQAMIEGINPPSLLNGTYLLYPHAASTDIVGMKTIRFFHGTNTTKDEINKIHWLKMNFPCSRILVNINSNVQQYASSIRRAWKRTNFTNITDDTIHQELHKQNQQLRKVVKRLGRKQAFLLDKEEWTNNITKLNEAVTWMGFHTSCHFTELLEFNNKDGYGHSKTRLSYRLNPKTCKRLDDRTRQEDEKEDDNKSTTTK